MILMMDRAVELRKIYSIFKNIKTLKTAMFVYYIINWLGILVYSTIKTFRMAEFVSPCLHS